MMLLFKEYYVVKKDTTLDDFFELLANTSVNIFPVLNDEDGLEGVILLDDVRKYMFDKEKNKNIKVVAKHKYETIRNA